MISNPVDVVASFRAALDRQDEVRMAGLRGIERTAVLRVHPATLAGMRATGVGA